MNSRIDLLQAYPFERLRALLRDIAPAPLTPLDMSIGEPKHETPLSVIEALTAHLNELSKYPATSGLPLLRETCARWCQTRCDVGLDPESEIIPVAGSREALFSFVQAALNTSGAEKPAVVCPNPFYQIYEGATILAGGETAFANTRAPDFLPAWSDIDEATWRRTQIVFVCSPGNPTGAVLRQNDWEELFSLQDRYGFIIASDECYSEIYDQNPPLGILRAAQDCGRDKTGKIMFTSLSKRSNVPGLRSGFVAGDAEILRAFLKYRTYHGCAVNPAVQYASVAAWNDETHVNLNRALYREKFARVVPILRRKYDVTMPDASFYLWLPVPGGDDRVFTRTLWQKAAIKVLPGQFLARETPRGNPGRGYVRLALVASLAECEEAAERMVRDEIAGD